MFRDEGFIEVIAGDGGDGIVSFRREKYVTHGGPDGGDGGRGGTVLLVASGAVTSLLGVARRFRYAAEHGRPGGPRNRTGRSGVDLVIEVPIGTLVMDRTHGNVLRDLDQEGARVAVAVGGKGGKGNARFATAEQQTPRHSTPGKEGERRELKLELKLFADVGLIGLPNAGKSTFLSVVSAARPKIADYPFTTLHPEVGIVELAPGETLVVADLPGLIEGAAEGHGLGHRFLKHVERCGALMQLVDVSPGALEEPCDARQVILEELAGFSAELMTKPRLLVASKCEGPEAEERALELERASGEPVHRISSQTHRGVAELLATLHARVRAGRPADSSP